MYKVYILLLSGDRKIYIGVSGNLERRLSEHKNNLVQSTRRRFVKLLYVESFNDKKMAWKRENWLKSGKGKRVGRK